MPKLTFLLEAVPGTDLQATASAVQAKAAELPHVTDASAEAMVTHGLGLPEIMLGLQTAGTILTTTTTGIVALTALIQALKKLSDEIPALSRILVQVGLKKVPVDQLTEHDMQKLSTA
jgi:hypothetical protein